MPNRKGGGKCSNPTSQKAFSVSVSDFDLLKEKSYPVNPISQKEYLNNTSSSFIIMIFRVKNFRFFVKNVKNAPSVLIKCRFLEYLEV